MSDKHTDTVTHRQTGRQTDEAEERQCYTTISCCANSVNCAIIMSSSTYSAKQLL